MGNEDVTLLGRSLAPLREFKLQRRPTTWGVFDANDGHRVAEVRLTYCVATTPSAVRNPHASDAKQTEVTVAWTEPASDHGEPIEGYRIAILVDRRGSDGPQWHVLCECTKSLTPAYLIGNLVANTAYMVDVRAKSKVGYGDPGEFTIITASCEPDPPCKPWVHEVRDGCVNVAWHPPESDGGSPVTAYRLRLRKVRGGFDESTATWHDMGTVGAAMRDGQAEGQSMYTAWLGPLEKKACEYRFQVVAVSRAGESRPSEISEPHYV